MRKTHGEPGDRCVSERPRGVCRLRLSARFDAVVRGPCCYRNARPRVPPRAARAARRKGGEGVVCGRPGKPADTSRNCSPAPTEVAQSSYLVDPASSHMLVSKIKPCMSKYTPLHGETANGSLNQLWFLRSYNPTWITVAILELIHATRLRPSGKSAFVSPEPTRRGVSASRRTSVGDSEQLCADRTAFEPATHLSSVCPINCRWYVLCLPW